MAKKNNLTKEDAKLIINYLDHAAYTLDELIKECRELKMTKDDELIMDYLDHSSEIANKLTNELHELLDILTNKSRVNNTSYYEKR